MVCFKEFLERRIMCMAASHSEWNWDQKGAESTWTSDCKREDAFKKSNRCGKSPRLSRHDSLQSGQLCSGGAVNAESVCLFTSQTKWIRGPTKKLGSKLIPFSKLWLYGYSWLMLSQSIMILLYYCIKAGHLEFGRALCQDNDSKFGTLVAMKKPRLLELLGSFFSCQACWKTQTP